MGNVFRAGRGPTLSMSNGGTAVFVEVMLLAVSELAVTEWDHRFAALMNRQDQNVMGRGFVGFDLVDVDWGTTSDERARAKDFVLRATALAVRRHRWDELGYDPPFVHRYLDQFAAMAEAFVPDGSHPVDPEEFPAVRDRAVASCVRHKVLNALPMWDGCIFCG